MKIFAQKTAEELDTIVARSASSDDGMLKFIALGGLVLFVALVIAILVARRK